MDESINNSSMSRAAVVSKGVPTEQSSAEESGWTSYFQDLSDYRENSSRSSFGSSSMISDAASFPAWKSSHCDNNHVVACSSAEGSLSKPKTLNFMKKTRAKEISYDASLEDTASSPVSSPKVSELLSIDMNPRKRCDHFNTSRGKGGTLEHYGGLDTEERCELDFNGENNCTHLKRGLCLVPFLSMLINYLG